MNLKVQLTRALIISIISLAGFALLATMVTYDKIIHFDSIVISFIQGFEAPTLTVIMKLFTNIGSTVSIVKWTPLSRHEFLIFKVGSRMRISTMRQPEELVWLYRG